MPDVPRLQRYSLRTRITALATVVVALVLAGGGWVLVTALRRALVDDVARAAALRSRDLATLVDSGGLPRPIPVVDPEEALVEVVRNGRVVASSANAPAVRALDVAAPAEGATRVVDVGTLPVAGADEGGFLVAATTIGTAEGPVTVHVASSLGDVDETVAATTRLGLLALPVLVVVLAGAVWVLVGRTLAPVDAIRAEAEAVTGSDLHRRVPEPGRLDEVGRLARTLNGMLDRLEGAVGRQRHFVADAAHELRTPVASIRATVETARASPRRVDWDLVAADVLADTIRMQQLTEQLLLLARIDAGRLLERPAAVDLDDVVAEVVATVDGGALDVTVARLDAQQVAGDAILLGQVVRNLVDNAAAHADHRVEVALHRRDGHAVLTVDDDGPGIPPEQREAVFERFVRLDGARTRQSSGGAGLGLAIVGDIVAAHGGSVAASGSPLGGARFEVVLPDGP
jgi:signal transduction histidine kinase